MNRRLLSPTKTLVHDARAALASCAGLNSRLAARRITQFLENRMTSTGLSIAQFGLMAHVAAALDDTLGALAARTRLDQSTLSRNLHGLERGGLVEIAIIHTDLRRRSVWLTEVGARRLELALPIWQQAHASLAELIEPHLLSNLAAAAETLLRE
jgi:DNA-binding MarR family transcriptional regulator